MESLETSHDGCNIFYSTQSGRAKACARRCARLVRETTRFHVLNRSGKSFDEAVEEHGFAQWCESVKANKSLLLLFISTTGDGEHTDSIQRTWKHFLQKSLPSDLLGGVSFAIFNLGDRAYGPNFCAAGRKLTVRLIQLGAAIFGEPGYGDDGTPNGGVFADLDEWMESQLLPALRAESGDPEKRLTSYHPDSSRILQTPYKVSVHPVAEMEEPKEEEWEQQRYSSSYQEFFRHLGGTTSYSYDADSLQPLVSSDNGSPEPLVASVCRNDRITAINHDHDTRQITLEVQSRSSSAARVSSLPYRAGDVASVLPSNSDKLVDRFLKVMPSQIQDLADCEIEIRYDKSVEAKVGVGYAHWPRKCTLRGWLTYCADIHSLPEREDLRSLSHFCTSAQQKEKLVSLSETSESALYADYILREKRTWAEVLYDFDSLHASDSMLNVECLLALLSPIRPRDFSIASSPTEFHRDLQQPAIRLELCVAIVTGTTPLGRGYYGLCSEYLSRQTAGEQCPSKVRLWIKPGSLGHALESKKPVLCVGAGTGVAPLRSILREAVCLQGDVGDEKRAPSDRDQLLVFGCRKESCDFYYKSEWNDLTKRGYLGLWTAFSRDQWHKIYVQQRLEETQSQSKLITHHLLERQGSIYVAGGPSMARTVKQVIVESISRETSSSEKETLSFLSKLQRQGRFGMEAW